MRLLCDIGILLCVTVPCLVHGCQKPLHYLTFGYATSILFQGTCIWILYKSEMHSNAILLHTLLIMVYGLRLTVYLLLNSFNRCYNETAPESVQYELTPMKSATMLCICAFLFLCMVSSLLADVRSSLHNDPVHSVLRYVGIVAMIAGISIESVADVQRTLPRKPPSEPHCSRGLFTYVRMPNYAGEILFWVGNYIISLAVPKEWILLLFTTIGVLFSVGVLIYAAYDLDQKQLRCYGANADYMAYRRCTGVLCPFVPEP